MPAADFAPDIPRERLADRAALERCARAHHEVVAAAAGAGPAVPVPLATLYADETGARRALDAGRERFLTALERVAGRAEWGVKVFAQGPPPAGVPAGTPPPPSGRVCPDRVRARQQTRAAREENLRAAAERVHGTLSALAAAARRLRPQAPGLTGDQRPQLLDAAYLVDHGRTGELTAAVAALREESLLIETTGPWAPYSFTAEGGGDEHH